MIKHVYLYQLREKEMAGQAAERLLTMKERIPSVADVEVGIDMIGAAASFDLMELVCCETEEDFQAFCVDPYHDEIRAYMSTIVKRGYKVDYRCESYDTRQTQAHMPASGRM